MEKDNETYIFTTGDWCGRNSLRLIRKTKGNKRKYPEIFSSCLDGTMNFHLWTPRGTSYRMSHEWKHFHAKVTKLWDLFLFLTRERGQELFICTINSYFATDFNVHTCAIFVRFYAEIYVGKNYSFLCHSHIPVTMFITVECVCMCVIIELLNNTT